MERPAEETHPHGTPLLDRLAQLRRVEPLDTRPQSDVWVAGLLGLHPDELLDDVERRPSDPLEQKLAREQRPVKGSPRQYGRRVRGRHARLARSNASSVSLEKSTNVTESSASGCSAIQASTVCRATGAARSTG